MIYCDYPMVLDKEKLDLMDFLIRLPKKWDNIFKYSESVQQLGDIFHSLDQLEHYSYESR